METLSVEDFKQAAKKSKQATLEEKFLSALTLLLPAGVPLPIRQHRPIPSRKFQCDFAWPEIKLSVEIHGGSFRGGGHNTALGQAKDFEKHNLMAQAGWVTLYFNTQQLKDAADCAAQVIDMIAALGERYVKP